MSTRYPHGLDWPLSLRITLPTMLQRTVYPQGLVTYHSPRLARIGVPHAFTTRLGGVSEPPFNSLNFQPASRSVAHLGPGPKVQMREGHSSANTDARSSAEPAPAAPPLISSAPPVDQYETVVENFRRVAAALSCPDRRTICIWQVHGRSICHWPAEANDATPADPTTVVAQADALITTDAKVLLSVRVADCVPVLLADATGRFVAAVHAGWRGITANIIAATLDAMQQHFAIAPSSIIAAIGPCISTMNFEVGVEVADAFDEASLSEAVHRDYQPRPHIDLQLAMSLQLQRAGVPLAQIDGNDRCTYRDQDEFYSHRRDAGRTGRMAAIIGAKAE